MQPKSPVQVVDLFPVLQAKLLELLGSLMPEQFQEPSSCPGWSVQDLTAHLLGDDLGILSGGRDRYSSGTYTGSDWQELLRFINDKNEAWVAALRRLSPRVLIELLESSGARVHQHFASLDLMAPGPNVAWAGSGPMPMWLHVAREYTERWIHQMQIRDAVGAPALDEPRLLHPLLDTFVHALPVAFRDTTAPAGAHVAVEISGAAGGTWSLIRGEAAWELGERVETPPTAVVLLDPDTAWRLWTKGIQPEGARNTVTFEGDKRLCEPVLNAVAMIV